ncbi:Transcription factor MYC/MYB N-terminal - like 4 [Theobroma cacao]|uniref:Truncated basic helix-loop-helix protein A isoform X1 n=1 Tax=Theobroma cacao TaxID=3641 RepID=A0AB32VUZ9_THECC|nr:PREDICTED: truncated basic helix-loop-helix protein A isoform X1 [Theobroma cacao]WRX13671.1 Transcription factor MYC/MYB N-terminal - like 3 [Theobroma cacao]WRX16375.1 Transcription factor MYC/MYB N-terminal - like 4 [Theobroma cacao]
MEEHLSPLAVTHLLQHTLRSLCIHENSQWVYAVFWRILPRNYPPPKWDGQAAYDRSRGNRRNWILVWEDGFCNFAASAAEINSGDCTGSSVYGSCEFQHYQGLQPELFFKMSHEIYNYGEGLIGKVAADHSHKWIYKEPNDQEINFLSAWHNSADSVSHPRTWEAQFQAGIKTIALIAVREGVVQLGAVNKVIEDLSYVVLLRKKFSYIESIPGVLLPHPSSSAYPFKVDGYGTPEAWHFPATIAPPTEFYDHFNQPMKITPSMSSLEALLSKLPSVVPPQSSGYCESQPLSESQFLSSQRPVEYIGMEKVAKEEIDEEYRPEQDVGESSSSISAYRRQQHFHHHQDLNVTSGRPNSGF